MRNVRFGRILEKKIRFVKDLQVKRSQTTATTFSSYSCLVICIGTTVHGVFNSRNSCNLTVLRDVSVGGRVSKRVTVARGPQRGGCLLTLTIKPGPSAAYTRTLKTLVFFETVLILRLLVYKSTEK